MICFYTLFTICFAVLPRFVAPDDGFPAIISDWHKATADTRAVRATVHLIQYDDEFNIQTYAIGEFAYRTPNHGFWRLTNDSEAHHERRVAASKTQYEVGAFRGEHFRWHGDRFLDIDERDRSFQEFTRDQSTNSYLRMFGVDLFRTVDFGRPFLPGRPNKAVATDFTYSLTKETDSQTWVRATARPGTLLHGVFYDLCFQRDPARLVSTRATAGHKQTVLIFSDVQLDPEPWSEPDLTLYKKAH